MRFQFNLYEKILSCLKSQPEQRFTAREIAEWIFKTYREDCEKKRYRSEKRRGLKQDLNTDEKLIGQIRAEITASKPSKKGEIKEVAGRPRQFYWTEKTDAQEIAQANQKGINLPGIKERLEEQNIYPLLQKFLLTRDIYSKRINEKTSKNSRGPSGNKWLHPDIAGNKRQGAKLVSRN